MVFDNQRLIHHFLESSAQRHPDKIAMLCGQQRYSYEQLELQSDRLAAWLISRGLEPGERVLLVSENGPAYVAGYFGTLKAGGVVVPVNTEWKSHDLRRIAREVEAAILLSSRRFERLLLESKLGDAGIRTIGIFGGGQGWPDLGVECHDLDGIVAQGGAASPGVHIEPDSLASIIYTSGSTGKPKGVMLSHRNIISNVHAICQYQALTEDDIHMVVLPFFYVMGQSLLNTHFAVGGTVVVNNQFAYPASVVKQMVEARVTGFSGVPSTFAYLIHRSPLKKMAGSLQSLRFCAQAGGHMATHLKKELRAILPAHTRIYIMYGATEAAARITYLDPECFERKIGSIGMPIPGMAVKLLGPDKREMPPREEGELVASGPNIMLGYWRDPDATAAVLDHDGYHTGDVGYRDDEGFIYVTGRKDSLLKVSGHRINPQEIEDALVASGLLIEVAVVGQPDEMAGNRLVAVATPRDETCRVEDLLRHCAERLPAFKVPSEIRLIKSLPKNASGKIDRHLCETLVRQAPDGR